MSEGFRLSVAIPLHNEESVLPELLRRTLTALDEIPGGPHELLFVDDGSTDRTVPIVHEAAERDSRVVIVTLSPQFRPSSCSQRRAGSCHWRCRRRDGRRPARYS